MFTSDLTKIKMEMDQGLKEKEKKLEAAVQEEI
jgi:hypothetical protein